MLRFVGILLLITSAALAEKQDQLKEQLMELEQELNIEMCRSIDHRYDPALNECIYCAQGLTYNNEQLECQGVPSILGKCYGEDHYHAATRECMYCAKGYAFNEDIRACAEVQEKK